MESIKYKNIEFYKIKDSNDYYISKCGKVLSTKKYNGTNIRILKSCKNSKGYLVVGLRNNNKSKTYDVHRLVAETLITNIENKPEVNHINSIRDDNRVSNLEWCTRSENVKHSYDEGLKVGTMKGKLGIKHPSSKKVEQLDINNNLINVWDSIMDVQRELGINNSHISQCCLGRMKTIGGFKWRYKSGRDNKNNSSNNLLGDR